MKRNNLQGQVVRLETEKLHLENEIERLNKENKILRENAEHNDKVVDKVNWENKKLNNIINEFEKSLKEEKTRTRYANDVERFTAYDFALKKLQELRNENDK